MHAGPAVGVPYGQRECRDWYTNCQADVDNLREEHSLCHHIAHFTSHFCYFQSGFLQCTHTSKTELWICNTGRRGYIFLLSDSWSPGSVHPDVHKVMNFMKDFTTTYTCPVLILMRTKKIYRSTASFSFSQT